MSPLELPPGLKLGSPWTRQSASRDSYLARTGTETEYRQTTDNVDSMPDGLTSRWGWYWVRGFPNPGQAPKCKAQNSGLHSKEEKPRDPINQPSRCNAQEGLLTVEQTGNSDLLGGRAPRIANSASFYRQKNTLSVCYLWLTK